MRPIALRVAGFTCFRDPQPPLDFTGLDLFAIAGPTGAGKSSVLDAMTYALYGKVPRMGGQGVRELISHGRDRMTVSLTFAVGGHRYLVCRSTRRAGAAQCQLDRLVGDQAEPVASGVTAVNEAVRRLVGLDYDAFTQAVMLPQGEFARFLKGAAADRRRILQELLRLTVYNRMRELAGQRLGAARTRVDLIGRQMQSFVLVTPEALAHLEAERAALDVVLGDVQRASEEARTQRDALQARLQIARELAASSRELEALVALDDQQRRRIERIERSRRALQVAPSIDQLERDESTRAAREREFRDAQAHLAEVTSAHGRAVRARDEATKVGEQLPALRTRVEALRALEGRIRHQDACAAERRRLERDWQGLQAELGRQEAALRDSQHARDDARAGVERATAALRPLAFDAAELSACERGRDQALELRRDRRELPVLHARTREARAARDEADRVQAAAVEEAERAAQALARATLTRDETWRRQRATADAHRAMALRSHLEPGHTCPVCEQGVAVVPPVLRAPEQAEADEAAIVATETVRHAELVVQRAQQALARAAAAADGARSDVERADRQAGELRTRVADGERALRAVLSRYLPPTAEGLPEHWLLERVETLREMRAAHEAAERALQVARETLLGAETTLAIAIERRDGLSRESGMVRQQLDAKQRELEEVSAEIRQVTTADDPAAELAELSRRVEGIARDIAAAEAAVARGDVALATAKERAGQAERVYVDAADALARVSDSVAQALSAFGFARPEEARLARLEPAVESQLQRECDEHAQRHAVLSARVSELAARVGPTPPGEADLAVAVAATARADVALSDAMRRRGELTAQVSSMAQRLEESAAMRAEFAHAEAEQETYAVLSADLQANAFQDWLLTEVFERIVQGASTRLMDLTGRYTLEWVGNEFYVVDHDNARERRTADTLSGGETFLASLALALELSEQVQRAAGAVRLDSLFIDEGFGSLDANAQEVVANAIESLQVTGRMVGIITHIRELTDRMPACIVIDKRPDGSRWSITQNP